MKQRLGGHPLRQLMELGYNRFFYPNLLLIS